MTNRTNQQDLADADGYLDFGKLAPDYTPYEPPAPGRHIRLKITPSGHVSPTHPQAPLGKHGSVRTVQINSIPSSVSLADVVRLYSATVDLTDSPMWEFEMLGTGKILR